MYDTGTLGLSPDDLSEIPQEFPKTTGRRKTKE